MQDENRKQVYASPQLITYGSVEELTSSSEPCVIGAPNYPLCAFGDGS